MSTTWPLCPGAIDLATIDWLGHRITVHELAVPAFQIVEIRAGLTQYGTWLASAASLPSPTGAYNCRNRRPYPETPVTWAAHSEHAHAVACDINYDSNPISFEGYLKTDFDRFGYTDACDWLACFLEPPEGLPVFFRWGGGWTADLAQACVNLRHNGERIRTGTVDAMHMELALTKAETEQIDWDRLIAKENAMRKEIEDAATFLSELREELVPGKDDATVGGAAKRVASAVTWVEKTKAAAK